MANKIIEKFKLKPTKNPIPIAFMGRRQGSDFTKTTLDTWKSIIPEDAYRIGSRDQEIIIKETVKIYYGGLDSKKNISKFNSGEMSFAFVDQAEEIEEERLVAELRLGLRKTIAGKPLPRKILWTANPRPGWLKDQFITTKNAGKAFLPALPYDNPHLPEWYISKMEEDLKYMPQLLKAYRDGSWEVLAGADQIIQEHWLGEARNIKLHLPPKAVIAVDPARFGDDQLVIFGMVNSKIIDYHFTGMSDSNYILKEIESMAFRMKEKGVPPSVIGCDITGGYGSGVEDNIQSKLNLWSFPCKFVGINFAHGSPHGVPDKYLNRRAEMYMNAQEMFATNQIEMDFTKFPELGRQLLQPRYDFRNGKTYVQPKDDIKKAYGKSPDMADAYVIGLHILQYAIEGKQDTLGLFKRKKNKSWMAS